MLQCAARWTAGASMGPTLAPGFLETKVTLETSRGRAIGDATVELVDFSWGAASYLWHPSGTRKEIKVLGFEHLGQIGRPNKASAYVAADAWISAGDMDEDTAADYATGEELGPDEPEEPSMVNGAVDPSVVEALQQRILELEQQVAQHQPSRAAPVPQALPEEPTMGVIPTSKAPPLFGTPGRGASCRSWQDRPLLALDGQRHVEEMLALRLLQWTTHSSWKRGRWRSLPLWNL